MRISQAERCTNATSRPCYGLEVSQLRPTNASHKTGTEAASNPRLLLHSMVRGMWANHRFSVRPGRTERIEGTHTRASLWPSPDNLDILQRPSRAPLPSQRDYPRPLLEARIPVYCKLVSAA